MLRAPSLADVQEDSELGPGAAALVGANTLAPPTPPLGPASRPGKIDIMAKSIIPKEEDDDSRCDFWFAFSFSLFSFYCCRFYGPFKT